MIKKYIYNWWEITVYLYLVVFYELRIPNNSWDLIWHTHTTYWKQTGINFHIMLFSIFYLQLFCIISCIHTCLFILFSKLFIHSLQYTPTLNLSDKTFVYLCIVCAIINHMYVVLLIDWNSLFRNLLTRLYRERTLGKFSGISNSYRLNPRFLCLPTALLFFARVVGLRSS